MNNMETFWSTSHAAGAQSSYLESLYELYLKDPSTVPDDWKIYFDSLPIVSDEQHEVSHQEIVERLKEEEINPPINAKSSDNISNSKQVKVIQLIQAYRNRGHYKAKLDPLGLKPTRHCDDLELSFHDLNSSDLSEVFNTDTLKIEKKSASLSEIIQALEAIYCGTLGIEYNYISSLSEREWFQKRLEPNLGKLKFNPDNLYVFVSQSGETADTAAALDICKKNNVKTCSVVNSVESTIARNSDWVLPIHAGPEIGVASTKAFLGQMLVLYILCLKLAQSRKDINDSIYQTNIKNLKVLPDAIKKSLKVENKVQAMAKEFLEAKGSMFLGRGLSFPIALEGALKLKELSYLHAEGYPAGEMKHGPLALIEEGLPVIVIAPKDKYFEKTLSNMQEVIARGGKILFITDHKKELRNENIRFGIRVPEVDNLLSPILLTIPIQLLAYHVALLKGCDIDKPRNLAKSVTVE